MPIFTSLLNWTLLVLSRSSGVEGIRLQVHRQVRPTAHRVGGRLPNGGGAKLVKQGSVTLLNAYARRGFPFDSWEVKALLLEALVSEQAERFEQTVKVKGCTVQKENSVCFSIKLNLHGTMSIYKDEWLHVEKALRHADGLGVKQ
ncbi:hypothetical protein GUJ93_ZPchr0014g46694 [Zizania palustris]|uniref:Uncharacterized protein n=1 Tax=Zizania palustris TaxID=103762 RepID=A0A8J5TAF1_ZIZPA|nr:hypothetical protein GUJ93_ZPchr0014g46694 [Zizania palustris]